MPDRSLPFQYNVDTTPDIFYSLFLFLMLSGLALISLIIAWALLMKLFKDLGIYNPTGPIGRRMIFLLTFTVLVMIVLGGIVILMSGAFLDPKSGFRPYM